MPVVAERLVARPATVADVPALVELFDICSFEDTGAPDITAEKQYSEWEIPGFNVSTDTYSLWTINGQVVAYADVLATSNPPARNYVFIRIHPDFRKLNLGSQLLEWAEQRMQAVIKTAPPEIMVPLTTIFPATNTYLPALFSTYGYQLTRHFWRMVVDLTTSPPVPHLPEGIIIRSYDPDTELVEMVKVIDETFKDHWGNVDQPLEKSVERWNHYRNDHTYDPTLWFLAMDGNDIAGYILCWKNIDDDPQMGWVGTLGVRRPWRRKGLALTLLHHAFGEFYRRGQARVGLGVDASNLTGATRLYERAGMYVARQDDNYEKVLRPGIDLRTQQL